MTTGISGLGKKGLAKLVLFGLATALAHAPLGASSGQEASPSPTGPRHVNRAVDALSRGVPVFTIQLQGGSGYEEGRRYAGTKADFITYEMEHGTFDLSLLREFMRGITDGAAGQGRVPVIVTLPMLGTDAQSMKANSWVVRQVLAAGVSGILLCQVESSEAVRIFVEATRYPFAKGTDPKLVHRGFRSEDFATGIWGVSQQEYFEKADPWPLNPNGDLLLGIKIESPTATDQVETLLGVPGIALVEWAPGDQSFFLFPKPYMEKREVLMKDPRMVASRRRVNAAAKKAGVAVVSLCNVDNVIDQLKTGTKVCYVNDDATIEKGRAFARATTQALQGKP